MKKTLLTTVFTVVCLLTWATNYETISSGNWNDPTIWSTDGGNSSCSCVAPIITNGDNITINHDVILNDHLFVNAGTILSVNSTGSLLGNSFNLQTIGNSTINLNGTCSFLKITNGKTNGTSGSTINISSLVTANARIDIYAGTIDLNGGFLYSNTGNFNVHENGSFLLADGSKMELANGNISNAGYIDLGFGCCMTTTGNWTNELTGIVVGSGSATTTLGNMKNNNEWSIDITWCSAGFDAGMPSNENCNSSTGTCNGMMLPVEIVAFYGERRGTMNEIYWSTASEQNSDYFELYRSFDGYNWELITTVSAAGNSNELINYSVFDEVIERAVSYYRLRQIDFDGAQTTSGIIAVESLTAKNSFEVYPNPVNSSGVVIARGTESSGKLIVSNAYGAVVMEKIVESYTSSTIIQTEELKSGIYFITYVTDMVEVLGQEKLIIQ